MTTSTGGTWPAEALRHAEPSVFWLDDPAAPEPLPPLEGATRTDLLVVGGGYAGLWTALRAKQRDPSRDVVLIEAETCGHAASGRNGGFCAASLTHGFGNGLARWPEEMPTLERLGMENLEGIAETVERYGIDCHFERTGELAVATEPYQLPELAEAFAAMKEAGADVELLDAEGTRALVNSPTYRGAIWDRTGCAMVEPGHLAWGLRRACLEEGVRLHEHTPALELNRHGQSVRVRTRTGSVTARRIALATNAYPSLLRRNRLMTVPVYDYVLMSEPLTAEQRQAVGWTGRQGVGDSANQFHYYRLTRDDRILWGGYDAVYYYGSGLGPSLEQRQATFERLSEHFFATFPQLEGVRFTHRWGGAIDTCTRFSAFFGTALDGQVVYAAGFTGLGVGATRFAADVMLDLADSLQTPRTQLEMVRRRPMPFPPEPLRYGAIQLTRWSLDRADRHAGRRNLWLRALDRLGLGFDS
ncbi:MAG TPA: FAD-dependent oxidoreductase [Segeticoccus sp.]|uniref:NAD(P)/FAD-dependent oxidoreductase n=1 Tax=Segeticoccus sp. TaxID=2706531 RepID=UPI002D803961|nr:FAD-dependent oxidoreductase [Segeticoccus sp.]HET8599071.1 FAD-dependent oxidoreductase [Segeticoccus sp.]